MDGNSDVHQLPSLSEDGDNGHASDGPLRERNHHESERTKPHPHGRDYSEAPLVVTWELTQACDLACDHCRADANPERDVDELSTEEAIDLFEQVADFERNPFFVFSGGDPLKRPDVFELLSAADDIGLKPAITPATTSLLTDDTVEQLASAGARRMALSLDGATPAAHDEFRGEEGTFERAMRAAETASDIGLPLQINTTVTANTVDQLPGIADIADELDVVMWEVFFLVPIGRGTQLEQLSPDQARQVMEWLYDRSTTSTYRVITVEAPFYRRVARERQRDTGQEPRSAGTTGAGNGFVFVSHTGDVYPSGFLPLSAGNVRSESIVDIYKESHLMNQLRERNAFSGPCGSCPATSHCGGSRSRAYATTGEPTGSDPLCPWAAERMSNYADDG